MNWCFSRYTCFFNRTLPFNGVKSGNQLCNLFHIFLCIIYFLAFSLNLTVQFSVFGSILTAGGIVGALVNGTIADFIGRRGVRFLGHPFFLYLWAGILLFISNKLYYFLKFQWMFSWYHNADIVVLWDILYCRVACYSICKGFCFPPFLPLNNAAWFRFISCALLLNFTSNVY